MTALEHILAEQAEAARHLQADPRNRYLWLWVADLTKEEILIREEMGRT